MDGLVTPRPGRFTPGKDPISIVQEAGWASGPVWKGAENLAPHRDSIPGLSSPYRGPDTLQRSFPKQLYIVKLNINILLVESRCITAEIG